MGTLTLSGMAAGLSSGQITFGPVTMTGTAAQLGEILPVTLVSGDNSFAVPSGAYAVAVFLGLGVSATVKLRTNLNSGDAGLPVTPAAGTAFAVFPLPSGVSSVILNVSASATGVSLGFI